jgi:hypothetical protein
VLSLEARPLVVLDSTTDAEEARLHDWLHASGYIHLVQRAVDLAEEDRAA